MAYFCPSSLVIAGWAIGGYHGLYANGCHLIFYTFRVGCIQPPEIIGLQNLRYHVEPIVLSVVATRSEADESHLVARLQT
jgi:hypothetical protein